MNEMQELVEAYEKFEEVDKNFMVDMKAKSFNVDQKLLAFVFQQMQGCTLKEFKDFAKAIDMSASKAAEMLPIRYAPVAEGEYQKTLDTLFVMIDEAAEKKLLEQSNNGGNGTSDRSNGTSNGTTFSKKGSFFNRFFG